MAEFVVGALIGVLLSQALRQRGRRKRAEEKAQRLQSELELQADHPHLIHYRSCDCLGHSSVCCDPTCKENDCVEARQVP